jgi:hypothetical protein
MPKKSEYKQALAELRERHADKLEDVFMQMYNIVQNGEDDRDKINAAKVLAPMLGVTRPAPEKAKEPPPPPPSKKDHTKPELSPELKERLKNLYNASNPS